VCKAASIIARQIGEIVFSHLRCSQLSRFESQATHERNKASARLISAPDLLSSSRNIWR